MNGETQFMDARKTGRIGGWTRIKDGIRKRKKGLPCRKKCRFLGGKKELVG
jgi:hypothetical protein